MFHLKKVHAMVGSCDLCFFGLVSKIKFSSCSRCYTEACNERWDPSPRFSACTTQFRRNIAAVASRVGSIHFFSNFEIQIHDEFVSGFKFTIQLTSHQYTHHCRPSSATSTNSIFGQPDYYDYEFKTRTIFKYCRFSE